MFEQFFALIIFSTISFDNNLFFPTLLSVKNVPKVMPFKLNSCNDIKARTAVDET